MGGRVMEWREEAGVEWLEAQLPGPRPRSRTKAAFSTRSAGSAKESHEPIAAALGLSPERIVSGRQVHGVELAFHDRPGEAREGEVDGHVLAEPGAVGRMLDLPEVARRLLHEAGLEEIESARLCTCCEQERFFSHRRDGGPGRQAGLAWIEDAGE